MARVEVALRGALDASTLMTLVRDFWTDCNGHLPEEVMINFGRLTFIRPVGVTFLSNFIDWLRSRGSSVRLTNLQRYSAPISYLDDSLFFEKHLGQKLCKYSRPRNTTLPLVHVAHEHSHDWLRSTMIPWLARKLETTRASLHPLQSCISEIFNNTKDHSTKNIASIFVQHFPRENSVSISIADFGVGIPHTVRRVQPWLNDNQAILKAVERGFSSKTTAGNQGVGLDELLNSVVLFNRGDVDILSLNGHVSFYNRRNAIKTRALRSSGFCPGTTIAITLRTDTIEYVDEEPEELEW